MKKSILVIFLVLTLMFLPALGSKAGEQVTVSSSAVTATSITVTGTTDALAVMVRITDSTGNILAMQSFAVASDKSFSAVIGGLTLGYATYNVSVADYEGGSWTTVEVTRTKAASTAATVAANNSTWDGTAKALVTVTGEAVGGEMKYASTSGASTEPDASAYTTVIPTATDAGTYYVWYKVVGDADHLDSTPASVTVTIAEKTYTVTFNANGNGTAPTAQTVAHNGVASKPSDLTADGVTFGGWYKEAACTNAYDFSTPVTADITLYAKWTGTTPTPTQAPTSTPTPAPTQAVVIPETGATGKGLPLTVTLLSLSVLGAAIMFVTRRKR